MICLLSLKHSEGLKILPLRNNSQLFGNNHVPLQRYMEVINPLAIEALAQNGKNTSLR